MTEKIYNPQPCNTYCRGGGMYGRGGGVWENDFADFPVSIFIIFRALRTSISSVICLQYFEERRRGEEMINDQSLSETKLDSNNQLLKKGKSKQ